MAYGTSSRACQSIESGQSKATAFIESQQHHNRCEDTVWIFSDVYKPSLSNHNPR